MGRCIETGRDFCCSRTTQLVFLLVSIAIFCAPSLARANQWGLVVYREQGMTGVDGNLFFSQMAIGDPTGDWMNNHLWIDHSNVTYWIEAGINLGTSSQVPTLYSPTFEWTDSRPGGGYHEHQMGPAGDAQPNTGYAVSIREEPSPNTGTWDVNVGPYHNQSLANFSSGETLFAGGETEGDAVYEHMCYHDYGLGYYGIQGVRHDGWQNGGNSAVIDNTNSDPPWANWIVAQHEERTYDNEPSSC